MKKQMIYCSLTALMVYLLFCGPICASEQKTTELNRKMAEISSLQEGLSKKIELVLQKQEQLKQKVDELAKEIKLEKEQSQTESYLKAIQNPRIDFNLKLIQLLFGYLAGLTEKINYLQNGYETLDFFQQQVRDDLLMLKTLNDMEIDQLTAQINSVLDEFTPELGKPIFNTNDIQSKDTEKIWDEIIQQQNAKG